MKLKNPEQNYWANKMKDFYLFFDRDGLPIAVFLTETVDEAVELFNMLYRRPWETSQELGVSVMKEGDVPVERWDEIHNIKIRTDHRTNPQINLSGRMRVENSGLESERYMRR